MPILLSDILPSLVFSSVATGQLRLRDVAYHLLYVAEIAYNSNLLRLYSYPFIQLLVCMYDIAFLCVW